jgi:hypothetical protein
MTAVTNPPANPASIPDGEHADRRAALARPSALWLHVMSYQLDDRRRHGAPISTRLVLQCCEKLGVDPDRHDSARGHVLHCNTRARWVQRLAVAESVPPHHHRGADPRLPIVGAPSGAWAEHERDRTKDARAGDELAPGQRLVEQPRAAQQADHRHREDRDR